MKRRILSLLLALALVLGLAACAGPNQEEAVQTVVRCGLSNAWDSLMPYNSPSGSNYSRIIYDKIYDRLAYVHADGTLDPRGADSWESADGGLTALFHLSEKAAFHDGTPVTAQHWADTIALLTNPAPDCPTLGRGAFSVLAGTDETGAAVEGESLGAQAVDTYTLKLTFKTPPPPGGLSAGQEPGVLRAAHPPHRGHPGLGGDGAGAVERPGGLRPLLLCLRGGGQPDCTGCQPGLPVGRSRL